MLTDVSESPIPAARCNWPDDDPMQASDVESHRQGVVLTDEDEPMSQVYLSVLWNSSKLGAAYYNSDTCEIHVLDDTVDVAPEFVILAKVIQMCNPSVIVASTQQDECLLKIIRNHNETSPEDACTDEMRSPGTKLILEAAVDFNIGSARSRIVNLDLPGMPPTLTDTDKLIYMSSLINFDHTNMIRALGALLKYLDRKRINVELEDYTVKTPVVAITTFSVQNLVSVGEDTYRALQIFQKEWHPSVYKMTSGTKEGLSLFGIFNRCKSTIGTKEMRLWFLRPTREPEVLRHRQMAITFGIDPMNADVILSLQKNVKHVRCVSRILAAMNVGQCTVNEWMILYKSIYNAAQMGEKCRHLPHSIDIFRKISESYTQELVHIASLISNIVDFDEAIPQNKFVVKFGVNEELDEKKRQFKGLPDFMTTVAHQELAELDESVPECNVIYLPLLGYLLVIPMSPRMKETKDYSRPGLEFVFVSETDVYYKSMKTTEMDQVLGDMKTEIDDHEIRIMVDLQTTILEHGSTVLPKVVKYAAELDCLLAMAAVAKEFNYVRPKMTDGEVIHIDNGRHPLQELCVTAFVPNTTASGMPMSTKIKLLTGPNASGKSVYLKQVALIVYMAHIGSFVPAKSASIGHIDAIFSRIHTLESVSVGLSTFMIDLNQMSLAIRQATRHSLVAIDEFGKGTSAVDGMALLSSCIEHWASHIDTCPHVFVATHIYGVLEQLSDRIGNVITCQTMETKCEKEELAYLYQLVDGRASFSYAHWVALQANISRPIVERGLQITKAICESKAIPVGEQQQTVTQTMFLSYSKIVGDFLKADLNTEEDAVKYLEEARKKAKLEADINIDTPLDTNSNGTPLTNEANSSLNN